MCEQSLLTFFLSLSPKQECYDDIIDAWTRIMWLWIKSGFLFLCNVVFSLNLYNLFFEGAYLSRKRELPGDWFSMYL